MDLFFKLIAKVIGYTGGIILACAVLFRGVVSPLWGSASALGLLGAVSIGLLGLLVIIWLALKAIQNIAGDVQPPRLNDNFYDMGGDVMKKDED